jgi:hypothetical protein
MSIYSNGEWLMSVNDPTFLIQVETTSTDGNIAVVADGARINTSERYLSNTYRRMGDRP